MMVVCRGANMIASKDPHAIAAPTEIRRLAAVGFLDIVGYTRLMSADEDLTHRRWMRVLNEVIRPAA